MPGLSSADAAARLAEVGPNALPSPPAIGLWRRLLRQFHSPLVYILLAALGFDLGLWVVEGARSWPIEAIAIGLILCFNAVLGLVQERRSEAALAHLESLAGTQAWVVRDGQLTRVPTDALVPGDLVRLEAGDRVPADGTLVEGRGVMVDESVLTGESVPVDKTAGDDAFSGTLVARGTATVEVTRTGPASAMGRLATMLGGITAGQTPLERRVDRLGRQIAIAVGVLAAVLGVVGLVANGLARAGETVIFAVALAVAAVPEGLPAVLTVALALGVERMARKQAIVRRLSAVEALGSVTVIATDKTGTLTENRMDVRALDAGDVERALIAVVIANDADPATGAGDPMDTGLLRAAAGHGLDVAAARHARPIVSERPFDSTWKYVRVTVREDGHVVSYLKGAPEAVLARCRLDAAERDTWRRKAEEHAREGLRVVATAWGDGERDDELTLLGLALFWDPPRPEVAAAVQAARDAGIRVVMITGDHPATARAIAERIGLAEPRVLTGDQLAATDNADLDGVLRDTDVFARVQPEQKLALVEGLQAQGHIVAMTGDGVNDAPALKRSDVGVAMGQRGSDVSREVADLVLLDDNFATIVGAVEEGRGIYENIQTFLRFLFSTNLSEVLLIAAGMVLALALDLREADGGLLLPLTAAQILWINLITDGLPALALAFDRTPGTMQQPPRPSDAPLLDRPSLHFIGGVGVIKATLALAILAAVPALGYDHTVARATAFHFMAVGQLLLTYPSRISVTRPMSNPYLHAAVAIGVAAQLAAATIPGVAVLLGDAHLPLALWPLVVVSAGVAWAAAAAVALLVWRPAQPAGAPR